MLTSSATAAASTGRSSPACRPSSRAMASGRHRVRGERVHRLLRRAAERALSRAGPCSGRSSRRCVHTASSGARTPRRGARWRYEKVDTAALETEGGEGSRRDWRAREVQRLLSLEGHRLVVPACRTARPPGLRGPPPGRVAVPRGSRGSPRRPYEHYVPSRRDLSDLRARCARCGATTDSAAAGWARGWAEAPKILGQAAVVPTSG